MEIFIRPKTKEARKIIYMDLNEEQRREVDSKIFLPEKAYPKLERGRPARYDFLYIWIPNLQSSYVENVERYLSEKLDRPVFSYPKKIKDVNGYIFILPYRDVKTGKALSYTMKLYYTLRKDLYSLARGEVIKVEEVRPEERPAPEPEVKPEEKVRPESTEEIKKHFEIKGKISKIEDFWKIRKMIKDEENWLKKLEKDKADKEFQITRMHLFKKNSKTKDLQEKINKIESAIRIAKQNIDNLQNRANQMLEEIISNDEEGMAIKREIDIKRSRIREIEDELTELKETREELKKKLGSMKKREGYILQSESRGLNLKIMKINERMSILKAEEKELEKEIRELEDKLDKRIVELEDELRDMENST